MTKSEDERAVDRRRFLQGTASAGTAALWTLVTGVVRGVQMTGRVVVG